MKFRIVQFYPISCHVSPLPPNYLPLHPILELPQPLFFP
jgi:hypothetical protein